MKSVCIKTNNKNVINYLLNAIDDIKVDNVYYSKLKFKIYHNIIVHYKGFELDKFVSTMSEILSSLTVNLFEEDILKTIIAHEYFYFDSIDRAKILDFIDDFQDLNDYIKKNTLLYNIFSSYIYNNNKIFLDGFIPFRVQDYLNLLTEKVDYAVNRYLIDREYSEFISMLKMYVQSQSSGKDLVHLVYSKNTSVLLDENKNIIEDKSIAFNAKYLSDITFSDNDYALNTLLSIVPKKIYVHLIDKNIDEFIQTLKLIFEDKIVICSNEDKTFWFKKYE